jgi:putative aldouronate transport system substrate-binding protein
MKLTYLIQRSIVCLVVLALFLVVGASMAESAYYSEAGIPICPEPITITVAGKENSGIVWNAVYLFQYIDAKLGIKTDITTYTGDQWTTQFPLMLATNDLPDLFVGANSGKADVNQYGRDGFLLDFSQYINLMPNYRAIAADYPLWDNYQRDTDGAIYGLSRVFPSRLGLLNTTMCTFIKKSWLEAVGMAMPKTWDEFYEVLKAFKEQDANGNGDPNDEIPLVIQMTEGRGTRLERYMYQSMGFYTIAQISADDNGQCIYVPSTVQYKSYMKFMNKLYAEGLLDPETFIMTDDERVDKIASDRAGFFTDYSQLPAALGGGDNSLYTQYDFLLGFTTEYADENLMMLGNAGYAGGSRTFAKADTKYPEAITRLVDYFMSPESVTLCDYGVEGETFKYVDDAFGNKIPSFEGFWEGKYPTVSDYQKSLRVDETFKLVRTSVENDIVENATDEMLEQMIYSDPQYTYTYAAAMEAAFRKTDGLANPYPDGLLYMPEETDEYASLATDIGSYVSNMKASFVMGEIDVDAGWDAYIAEMEGMGLARMMEIEQAAYDRFAKSK